MKKKKKLIIIIIIIEMFTGTKLFPFWKVHGFVFIDKTFKFQSEADPPRARALPVRV